MSVKSAREKSGPPSHTASPETQRDTFFLRQMVEDGVKFTSALSKCGIPTSDAEIVNVCAQWDTCRSLLQQKKSNDVDITRLAAEAIGSEKMAVSHILSSLMHDRESLLLQLVECKRAVEVNEAGMASRMSELTAQYDNEMESLLATIEELKSKASGTLSASPVWGTVDRSASDAAVGPQREEQNSCDGRSGETGEPTSRVRGLDAEVQTDFSFEFMESYKVGHSEDATRSTRRERENDVFELLVKEIQALRESLAQSSSKIQLLEEQRQRFLRSVSNSSTLDLKSSLTTSMGLTATGAF
ncbi:hypothetical protein AGDE_13945 [Angomonas deanei]|uniref:Uncharacterized protein n=1 Tax=Angomonas deanei TaxID=59799 RepID=A0A7G2CKR4_9TRYP|nr:hypothetical protein AGDE_13945 [Angomonas deanei]CAD2220009.1 hypothetical protein, conserved [Angomonas deanei]|eukprot:EPY21611.1 hypothetical protein AGDE_13945 [Angomonas deanei]